MLTRSRKRGPARTRKLAVKRGAAKRAAAEKRLPDWDRAFREFGIDPSESGARERVGELAVAWLSPKLGRPKGASKWVEKRRAQLIHDVVMLGVYDGPRMPSQDQIARLLKERHPKRYATESQPWLRQCVSTVAYQASQEKIGAGIKLIEDAESARIQAAEDTRRGKLRVELTLRLRKRYPDFDSDRLQKICQIFDKSSTNCLAEFVEYLAQAPVDTMRAPIVHDQGRRDGDTAEDS
jgi:hypothetical protein